MSNTSIASARIVGPAVSIRTSYPSYAPQSRFIESNDPDNEPDITDEEVEEVEEEAQAYERRTLPQTASQKESLRFVRCEPILEHAISQLEMTRRQLPRREQRALETNNPRMAEMARDTVWAWEIRVLELGGSIEAEATTPITTPALPLVAIPVTKRPRCPHLTDIRSFAEAAQEKGLDMKAQDRCRGAVGMLLGRRIESRSDLNGAEWAFCANAIRMGRLFW
jgi:hypothetical protein